jgi:hypothetical protein
MPDRELERELRELGSMIHYPPTPDVARTVRGVLDEEQEDRPRRFRLSLPALRWTVVAAAFVLVVAVPALSPTLRATVSDLFLAKDTQMAGGPAVDAGSSERESGENAPASGLSKGGEAVTSPAQTPRFAGERITLPEARARMGGALLLPRTAELGKPDELYAIRTSRKDGVVLVYREGSSVGDNGISFILTEVSGEIESAYLAGKNAARPQFDKVSVNGRPGYWGSTRNLTSQLDQPLSGHVLLWKQRGIALQLEANLPKERALRIAESVH